MDNDIDLAAVFGRFAGQEVRLIENPYEIETARKTIKGTRLKLANDPDLVLEEIAKEADKHGLSLRTWFPDTIGTMDFRLDRLNIHVEKDDKGVWRVNSNISLG